MGHHRPQGEHRPEVRPGPKLPGGVQAVEHHPSPDHVQVRQWIVEHRRRVRAVPKGRFIPANSGADKCLGHLLKAAELPHGKGVALFALVGHGEVGEHPLGYEPGQGAGSYDLVYGGLVPEDVLEVEPQAAHARIYLGVYLHLHPHGTGAQRELLRIVRGVYALGDVAL